jgi:hypothetical protein
MLLTPVDWVHYMFLVPASSPSEPLKNPRILHKPGMDERPPPSPYFEYAPYVLVSQQADYWRPVALGQVTG